MCDKVCLSPEPLMHTLLCLLLTPLQPLVALPLSTHLWCHVVQCAQASDWALQQVVHSKAKVCVAAQHSTAQHGRCEHGMARHDRNFESPPHDRPSDSITTLLGLMHFLNMGKRVATQPHTSFRRTRLRHNSQQHSTCHCCLPIAGHVGMAGNGKTATACVVLLRPITTAVVRHRESRHRAFEATRLWNGPQQHITHSCCLAVAGHVGMAGNGKTATK